MDRTTPTPRDRADAASTKLALVLYAVRHDCDDSMELIELTDRKILNQVAHELAHVVAECVLDQNRPRIAERRLRRMLDQVAGGAR